MHLGVLFKLSIRMCKKCDLGNFECSVRRAGLSASEIADLL